MGDLATTKNTVEITILPGGRRTAYRRGRRKNYPTCMIPLTTASTASAASQLSCRQSVVRRLVNARMRWWETCRLRLLMTMSRQWRATETSSLGLPGTRCNHYSCYQSAVRLYTQYHEDLAGTRVESGRSKTNSPFDHSFSVLFNYNSFFFFSF